MKSNRTRFRVQVKRLNAVYKVILTARELGAVVRFLNRKTVAGDVALVKDVLRELVDGATPVSKSK